MANAYSSDLGSRVVSDVNGGIPALKRGVRHIDLRDSFSIKLVEHVPSRLREPFRNKP